jgi:putative ABC transport system permease protein
MLERLAWRNLWRNRRRTLLTMAAVFFAAVIGIFMRSLQIGTYRATIERVVTVNTAHLRVETPGYREEGSLDDSFQPDTGLLAALRGTRWIGAVSPRLETAGLASAGENTRGVRLSGLDPAGESGITLLDEKVVEGSWLQPGADSLVVLGRTLARNLGLGVGDEIVLITQTWFGTIGAALYRVGGLLDSGMPEVDDSTLFLTLAAAERLLDAEGRVTSILVGLSDPRRTDRVKTALAASLPEGLQAYSWRDLMPEIVQMIEFDSIGGWMFLVILLMVVGLGILNTVLMGVLERVKQFGVVMAVGMKPFQVARLIMSEGLMMGLVALGAGDLVGWLLAWYYRIHPMTLSGTEGQAMQEMGFGTSMPTYLDLSNFLMVNALVLGITIMAALYPALRAARYEPVEALRHV